MLCDTKYFVKNGYTQRVNEIDVALRGLPIRIWRRLVRTTQTKIQQVESALLPLELSMTEFDLLAVLRNLGCASQQDVAHSLLFTEANMSYHAKRMVARGLIERQAAGKNKILTLTDLGRQKVEEALPLVLAIHEKQFSDLSAEELVMLRSLLRRLK